jgi:tRNA 2-thiocytidine biosynthesis protein TtcA
MNSTEIAYSRTHKIDLRGVVKDTYKFMGKAIFDYQMLAENDKILIGVSGGSDSLSLLKLFLMRKERIPMKSFQFVVCFVDANFIRIDPKPLLDYIKDTGIECVVKTLTLSDKEIDCFWCSWNRRKIIFETARDLGCNKVALGHNLDDTVETTLMNMCFHGEISTMKPKIDLFDGRLTIIRPLCYVPKKTIANFASKLNLPVTGYECPFGKQSKRKTMKDIIAQLEEINPAVNIKGNIFKALKKIKTDYLP